MLGNTLLEVAGSTPATKLITSTLLNRAIILLITLIKNLLLYSNITQEYRKL